jgi:hypothetical protein
MDDSSDHEKGFFIEKPTNLDTLIRMDLDQW